MSCQYDAIIIGGGFYGCCLALFLRDSGSRVLILEKEADLLQRASYINQARVHNGYHYPRSLMTAFRSFINFPRFVMDFYPAIIDDFEKVYAIAARGSRIDAQQFFHTVKKIGAPIRKAPAQIRRFFELDLIEEVFIVKEVAFDAGRLKNILREKLAARRIEVRLGVEARLVRPQNQHLAVETSLETLTATSVYNCTYSMINKILLNSNIPLLPLKHEITEMALVEIPPALRHIAVTIMDGPFFSIMPFPPRQAHTLSHVRYTPHSSWLDQERFIDGHTYLREHPPKSHYFYMWKDAVRYMPLLADIRYLDSLYEVKTLLLKNEVDDGRPILYKKDYGFTNFSTIMGGKIDNMYDIVEMIKMARGYF
jgi:glycine/D-amino acid oxidase-like deaminating enzyme